MKHALALAFLALASSAWAQHHQHTHKASPYAGFGPRAIKALSDEQVADLRAGRGMGLALAAELNGYPGPMHVLELAQPLGLTADQRQHVQRLYDEMKAEAIDAGERLIRAEADLDRAFAAKSVDAGQLGDLTLTIGKRQGELRSVHLRYHLVTARLLTTEQLRRYDELRGYR